MLFNKARTALCAAPLLLIAAAAQAGTFQSLYAFTGGTDGLSPNSPLLQSGKTLYGTTQGNSGNSDGTVFTFTVATKKLKVDYTFKGFKKHKPTDGIGPYGGVTEIGSLLYGTTLFAGSPDSCNGGDFCGSIYAVNPKTRKETIVHSFTPADGGEPFGTLLNVGGLLYGQTRVGGTTTAGTVFSFDPSSLAVNTLYTFQGGTDGDFPSVNLVSIGTTLYGATALGGAAAPCGTAPFNTCGTLFSVDSATGAKTTLYSFLGGSDGGRPSGLVVVGNIIYGTTTTNGACTPQPCDGGTIFSYDTSTNILTTLYEFQGSTGGGSDGLFPYGAMIDVGGVLYGTTSEGGVTANCPNSDGCGTIFSYNIATGVENIEYAFPAGSGTGAPPDGFAPAGSMINVSGVLYGTTPNGGVSSAVCANGCGTIFSYKP